MSCLIHVQAIFILGFEDQYITLISQLLFLSFSYTAICRLRILSANLLNVQASKHNSLPAILELGHAFKAGY